MSLTADAVAVAAFWGSIGETNDEGDEMDEEFVAVAAIVGEDGEKVDCDLSKVGDMGLGPSATVEQASLFNMLIQRSMSCWAFEERKNDCSSSNGNLAIRLITTPIFVF